MWRTRQQVVAAIRGLLDRSGQREQCEICGQIVDVAQGQRHECPVDSLAGRFAQRVYFNLMHGKSRKSRAKGYGVQ
jgi:hypothetical protein